MGQWMCAARARSGCEPFLWTGMQVDSGGLCPEMQAQSKNEVEWVSWRAVNAEQRRRVGGDPGFKIILGLVISFVRKVINPEVKVYPAVELLGEGQIQDIQPRGSNARVQLVEPVIAD